MTTKILIPNKKKTHREFSKHLLPLSHFLPGNANLGLIISFEAIQICSRTSDLVDGHAHILIIFNN